MNTTDTMGYFQSKDEIFSILAEASKLYVSARKQHQLLLSTLRGRGVEFKDIRAYMLNRAAEVGLWSRGTRESELRDKAWYVTLQAFLNFTKRYSDYDILADLKVKNKATFTKTGKIKKTVVRKSKDGSVTTTSTETDAPTIGEKVELMKKKLEEDAKWRKEQELNKPVTEGLSDTQIWQIIAQNFHILGKFCEEKGAIQEFNELMIALGQYEEIVEIDDPVVVEQVEQMTQPVM